MPLKSARLLESALCGASSEIWDVQEPLPATVSSCKEWPTPSAVLDAHVQSTSFYITPFPVFRTSYTSEPRCSSESQLMRVHRAIVDYHSQWPRDSIMWPFHALFRRAIWLWETLGGTRHYEALYSL